MVVELLMKIAITLFRMKQMRYNFITNDLRFLERSNDPWLN